MKLFQWFDSQRGAYFEDRFEPGRNQDIVRQVLRMIQEVHIVSFWRVSQYLYDEEQGSGVTWMVLLREQV